MMGVLAFILMAVMLMTPSLCMEKGFFETVDEIGRSQRSLLQAEEDSGIGEVRRRKNNSLRWKFCNYSG